MNSFRRIRSLIRSLVSLVKPDSALQLFPPRFTLRDPIMRNIERELVQYPNCKLILLYAENFPQLLTVCNSSDWEKLQVVIQKELMELLPEYIRMEDLIGAKHHRFEDVCVFLRDRGEGPELHEAALSIGKALETKVNLVSESIIGSKVYFHVGFSNVESHYNTVEYAVQIAYRTAYFVAGNKLSYDYTSARKELKTIIDEEQLCVLAQPIMMLETGKVFGWEVLTRGPKGTPYHTPYELFHFAYQADLLSELELLVVKKALRQLSDLGIREQVFINVTPMTLAHPLFLRRVLELFGDVPAVSPTQIIFEITERYSIRDYTHMGKVMAKFREQGFRFAVDDAGAGYSSLQSILELIPDIIKIDRSLISLIDQQTVKQSMLRALLTFAEELNCEVIAEGVERKEEADILYRHNVKMGQGYWFAKPEPFRVSEAASPEPSRFQNRIPMNSVMKSFVIE